MLFGLFLKKKSSNFSFTIIEIIATLFLMSKKFSQRRPLSTTPPKEWIPENQGFSKIVVFFRKRRAEFSETIANVIKNWINPRIKGMSVCN
jgi:hypothetical protein